MQTLHQNTHSHTSTTSKYTHLYTCITSKYTHLYICITSKYTHLYTCITSKYTHLYTCITSTASEDAPAYNHHHTRHLQIRIYYVHESITSEHTHASTHYIRRWHLHTIITSEYIHVRSLYQHTCPIITSEHTHTHPTTPQYKAFGCLHLTTSSVYNTHRRIKTSITLSAIVFAKLGWHVHM